MMCVTVQGLVQETERLRKQVSLLSPAVSGSSDIATFNAALPSPVNPSTVRFLQKQSSFAGMRDGSAVADAKAVPSDTEAVEYV